MRKQRIPLKLNSYNFLWKIFVYICLMVGGFIALFPFYWMILNSFKPGWALSQWPPSLVPCNLTFENYRYIARFIDIPRTYFNSIVVSVSLITSNIVLGSMMAYALAKLKFPGRESLFLVILATMMIPFQLMMVPLYLLMNTYSLLDTYWALIFPTMVHPVSIFLLRQAFVSIPNDYIDAARIDGASHFRILFSIILPMARSRIVVVMIINLYWSWNAFLWPWIAIIHDEMGTLPVILARFKGFAEQESRWGPMMGVATLTAMPLIVVYLFAQKKFVKALTTSGLKG